MQSDAVLCCDVLWCCLVVWFGVVGVVWPGVWCVVLCGAVWCDAVVCDVWCVLWWYCVMCLVLCCDVLCCGVGVWYCSMVSLLARVLCVLRANTEMADQSFFGLL